MARTLNEFFGYGQVKKLTKTKMPHPRETDDSLSNEQLIGIEVEVEGITRPLNLKWWEIIEDGSLRDSGYEFRTQAFPVAAIRPVLTELYTALRETNPAHYFSERSSIHFHFDFRDKTVMDLMRLHLLYGITEPCLFRFGSPERMKSTFCVPLKDSIDPHSFQKAYQKFKDSGNDFPHVAHLVDFITKIGGGKYSALNLINLQNHNQRDEDGRGRAIHTGCGSVEFRQLQGTADCEKVITWGKILAQLVQSSKEIELEEIERNICHLNSTSEYTRFLEQVFRHSWRDILPTPYSHKIFSEGVSLAKVMIGGKTNKETPVSGFIQSPLILALQQRISGRGKTKYQVDAPLEDELNVQGVPHAVFNIDWNNTPMEQAVEVENNNPPVAPPPIVDDFEARMIQIREQLAQHRRNGGRR